MNAYLDLLTSTLLAPKSNIPDEALPTDPLTLKQQGEWVICDPPAFTHQAQEGIPLIDCLPDTARFPIAVEFGHGGDHCTGRIEGGGTGVGAYCHAHPPQNGRGRLPGARRRRGKEA